MSVFVDDYNAPFGRMIMCHMIADTKEELLAMADKIGLSRKWIQHEGQWDEHFDVCLRLKRKAIYFGAHEISARQLVTILRDRDLERRSRQQL